MVGKGRGGGGRKGWWGKKGVEGGGKVWRDGKRYGGMGKGMEERREGRKKGGMATIDRSHRGDT